MQSIPNFASLPTAELESDITQLCAEINTATYRQLTMTSEFDRRLGWGMTVFDPVPTG
jgi:hypothetical protein